MTEVGVQLSPMAQEAIRRWDKMPERIVQSVAASMNALNQETVTYIQERYLSFPKDGPTTLDGLRAITNTLRRAVQSTPCREDAGGGLRSSIGIFSTTTDGAKCINYALAHEFGAITKPHPIVATNAKALRFVVGGKVVFCKRVKKHPGSHIPARAPVERGIRDRLPRYGEAISRNIVNLWKLT